jgi:uncharacterized membrane protein
MIIRFFIYGIIGWIMEILWTGLGSLIKGDVTLRGSTYLWMFPIYGLAVFLEPLHDKIRFMHWILRGFIWLVIIWFIEYLSGAFLDIMIGECPWDYSPCRYDISGYIRLDYAPVWITAGLVFEIIHDYFDKIRIRGT